MNLKSIDTDFKAIPKNVGSLSQHIQLTQSGTHIALYYPAPKWTLLDKPIKEISPKFMFSYYIKARDYIKGYSLDALVLYDYSHGYLGGNLKTCWLMEEDECDNVISFLGVIRWKESEDELFTEENNPINKFTPYIKETNYDISFDKPTWEERQQATSAFGRDFLYPISEHRGE